MTNDVVKIMNQGLIKLEKERTWLFDPPERKYICALAFSPQVVFLLVSSDLGSRKSMTFGIRARKKKERERECEREKWHCNKGGPRGCVHIKPLAVSPSSFVLNYVGKPGRL